MIDVRGANVRAELQDGFEQTENENFAIGVDGDPSATAEAGSVGGRPLILDATKRAEICAILAAGCTFRNAARYVGCSAGAISMLLQRDESFRAQVDKALADRELIPLSHLRSASGKSWRAAAWLLERTVKGTYLKDNIADPADISRAVDNERQEVAMSYFASE
jgi:hypothetical protein